MRGGVLLQFVATQYQMDYTNIDREWTIELCYMSPLQLNCGFCRTRSVLESLLGDLNYVHATPLRSPYPSTAMATYSFLVQWFSLSRGSHGMKKLWNRFNLWPWKFNIISGILSLLLYCNAIIDHIIARFICTMTQWRMHFISFYGFLNQYSQLARRN